MINVGPLDLTQAQGWIVAFCLTFALWVVMLVSWHVRDANRADRDDVFDFEAWEGDFQAYADRERS